jgi:hypothetical protein
LRLTQIRFETGKRCIERAPATRFGNQTRFTIDQRGGCSVRQHGSQRQQRKRDKHFEQRKAAYPPV